MRENKFFLDIFCSIEEDNRLEIQRSQREDNTIKKIIELVEKKEKNTEVWKEKEIERRIQKNKI